MKKVESYCIKSSLWIILIGFTILAGYIIFFASRDLYKYLYPPLKQKECLYRLYESGPSGEMIFYNMDSLQTKRLGAIELNNDSTITITNKEGEQIEVQVDEKYIKPIQKVNKL